MFWPAGRAICWFQMLDILERICVNIYRDSINVFYVLWVSSQEHKRHSSARGGHNNMNTSKMSQKIKRDTTMCMKINVHPKVKQYIC